MIHDLKHWDLRTHFSAEEAACLAIGIDPAAPAGPHAPEHSNRTALTYQARTLLRDIEAAASMANACAAMMLFRESRWAPEELPPGALLSIEAIEAGIDAQMKLQHGEQLSGWSAGETMSFVREHLATWFVEMGFEPVYAFAKSVRSAPAVATTDYEVDRDRPLLTRERNTLLAIIGVLADAAKFDLSAPSKSAEAIVNEAALSGIALSRTGVANHLRSVAAAISARKK